MLEIRSDHLIYQDGKLVEQKPTPNKGPGLIKPAMLVMHYTAGFTTESAVNTLCNPSVAASAHVVIGRDGRITQLAPLNAKTWHAGRSSWKNKTMCNGFSIGIEMVNCGPMKINGKGDFVSEVNQSKVFKKDDVIVVDRALLPKGETATAWQKYPEVQFNVAAELGLAIVRKYGIAYDWVVGHHDIAPTRKRDPGPAWAMTAFKSKLFPDRK